MYGKTDDGKKEKLYYHKVLEVKTVMGDALYATEPMMRLCREKYHWEYIFTQKDTRQKLLDEGFEWIKSGGVKKISGLCEEKRAGCYANHVEKVAGKKETMNVFEYEYEKRIKTEKRTWHGSAG